jgi:hypothetical protein
VFFNDSNNPQLAVKDQLAITLYRFGHDGNAASLQGVANWAGVGKGTVTLCTRHVMATVLQEDFMNAAVYFPTELEKDEAKAWVQAHSCKAWRHRWCFVDGALVPLSNRPFWFGESYFDRKSNYSLNVQVCLCCFSLSDRSHPCTCYQIVLLPDLRMIDFTYGHTGSAHNATAWEGTQLYKEHETLLEDVEWVWGDSACPVCFYLT